MSSHRATGGSSRGGRDSGRSGGDRRRDDDSVRAAFSSGKSAARRAAAPAEAPSSGAATAAGAPSMAPNNASKKRFTGRCRLFVGNLPLDIKEQELRDIFGKFGEMSEWFLSAKGFAFVRMDTRAAAEAAKEGLDGYSVRGRAMRVRFAVHGSGVRVKELSPYVSNELLAQAFAMFGDVERAVHIVDEKGRPTGEGIVEFERKPNALEALRRAEEGVFLLSTNPKPVIVQPLEPRDEDDGLQERLIRMTGGGYQRDREQPPRFAQAGTFEEQFGLRWKELYQMEKVRREQLEQEFKEARERLENDMDLAYQDYQTQLMREELHRRQEELERLEAAKRDRMELMRRREEERMRRRDEPMGMGYGAPPQHAYGRAPPPQQPPPHYGVQVDQFRGGLMGHRPLEQQQPPPRGQGDETIVHGVQKLLQMFKGGQGQEQMGSPAPFAHGQPAFDARPAQEQFMAPQQPIFGSGVGQQAPPQFHDEYPPKRPRY